MSERFTLDRQSFEQILSTASLVQQLKKLAMCSRAAGSHDSHKLDDLVVAQMLAWLLAQLERAALLQAIERIAPTLERLVHNEENLQHRPPTGSPVSILDTPVPDTLASSSLRMAQLTQQAKQEARDTEMVDDRLTTAEAATEITLGLHYSSHDVAAIEEADDRRAIFGAALELAAAPHAGNHELRDTVRIDLVMDGVVLKPIRREEATSEPAVAAQSAAETAASPHISPVQVRSDPPRQSVLEMTIATGLPPERDHLRPAPSSFSSPVKRATVRIHAAPILARLCGRVLLITIALLLLVSGISKSLQPAMVSSDTTWTDARQIPVSNYSKNREVAEVSPRGVGAGERPERLPERSGPTSHVQLSHMQVTDDATLGTVLALSRFEIPGLQLQAQYGDAVAAFILGMSYETGRGVPQSCGKAATWVENAAMQGNVAAEYNLALRYRDGDGVSVSREKALNWLRKAADRGYSKARVLLALASDQELAPHGKRNPIPK
jgi:hypothetical protein